MKRWFAMIGILVLIIVLLAGVKGFRMFQMFESFKAMGEPKAVVSTTIAAYEPWETTISAVASVRAQRGSDLSAEVAGIVDEIAFNSGDDVKEGTLLLTLRAADDQARLESLKASAALAETTYKRDQSQFAARAISQATVDADLQNLKRAQADVALQQAVVDKKFIRAPFSGTLGIRAVDRGQYLNAGTKIVTLQQLDPLFVDFTLPQQALARIRSGQKITATADTWPDLRFSGHITAIEPQVDTDTRNVHVRGLVGNPQHKLLPGMFTRVTVSLGDTQRYLTLPLTAVAYNSFGETVYVVVPANKKDGKDSPGDVKLSPAKLNVAPGLIAKQIFVTTGPKRGDQVAILKGLNEGDQVVTTGQLKLQNGAAVVVDNKVQPTDDADPVPQLN
jgi:membrane fusion protein (multidrug efflux system)